MPLCKHIILVEQIKVGWVLVTSVSLLQTFWPVPLIDCSYWSWLEVLVREKITSWCTEIYSCNSSLDMWLRGTSSLSTSIHRSVKPILVYFGENCNFLYFCQFYFESHQIWYVDWQYWNWHHDFGCYGNHFGGKFWIPYLQNVCIYKLGWHSVNTIASVLNCISLERACHHGSLAF